MEREKTRSKSLESDPNGARIVDASKMWRDIVTLPLNVLLTFSINRTNLYHNRRCLFKWLIRTQFAVESTLWRVSIQSSTRSYMNMTWRVDKVILWRSEEKRRRMSKLKERPRSFFLWRSMKCSSRDLYSSGRHKKPFVMKTKKLVQFTSHSLQIIMGIHTRLNASAE